MIRPAGALVLLALLAGCGGEPAQGPAPDGAAAAGAHAAADAAACERHAAMSPLLRREAATYADTPVPPVRVALELTDAWEFYETSGAADPDVRRAMAGVAAAIADLDAQGQAMVPPGGTLMDPVRLDPSRVLAAVDAADRACAA